MLKKILAGLLYILALSLILIAMYFGTRRAVEDELSLYQFDCNCHE